MADLLQKRSAQKEEILKGRYIQKVLREEGRDLNREMLRRMASFTTETKSGRDFNVSGTTLNYKHRAVHRFIDMKTRQTQKGKHKKKNYPIHNQPLFGYANNIVRRLSFGFTDAVKAEMKELDGEAL